MAVPEWSVALIVGEMVPASTVSIVLVWAYIIIYPILLEIGMVIGYYMIT